VVSGDGDVVCPVRDLSGWRAPHHLAHAGFVAALASGVAVQVVEVSLNGEVAEGSCCPFPSDG
jgi:hypothetical protein